MCVRARVCYCFPAALFLNGRLSCNSAFVTRKGQELKTLADTITPITGVHKLTLLLCYCDLVRIFLIVQIVGKIQCLNDCANCISFGGGGVLFFLHER